MKIIETIRYWLKGIRVYIALSSVFVTILVIWWAHTAYSGTTLYASRVEESFAWIATGLLVFALAIGPLCMLVPKLPGKKLLFDARRLIGVSAAWFASLHASIAYLSQFKAANPLDLPGLYQRSFIVGGIALVILLAMAFTSFDRAFSGMGRWWFRLHRLVYIAAPLLLFHAFLTGVHATQPMTIGLLATASAAILGAYALIAVRKQSISTTRLVTLISVTVLLVGIFSYGLRQHVHQTKVATNEARP